jgi:sugar phosphate isomerase/epimerase
MITRREFGSLALAGVLVRLKPDTTYETAVEATYERAVEPAATVNGVHIGVQTYSFRDIPRRADDDGIAPVIAAMRACGLVDCELYAPQVAPSSLDRDALRAWRLKTPMDHYRAIRRRFTDAGLTIYAYNYSPKADYTDEEIDLGFQMAKALGASIITSSTTLDVAKRIRPFAEKHRMIVAMHGHSNIGDPNEFATPDSFAAALRMSPYFRINLDIGHFTAAGFDPVPYVRAHHADITNLHIKDMLLRKPESYVPWGTGDAPIRAVLQMLKRERWPIRTYLEYEYPSARTPVEEVKTCFAFAKEALA